MIHHTAFDSNFHPFHEEESELAVRPQAIPVVVILSAIRSLASLSIGEKFAAIVKIEEVTVLKEDSMQSKYRNYVPIKISATCGKYVRLGDSYLEGESYHPLKTFKMPWAGSGVVYRPEEASLADVLLFRNFLDV